MKKQTPGRIIPLFLLLFFFSLPVGLAVDNLRIGDMRSLAMGGNGVTQSVYANPALLSMSSRRSVQAGYFNRYGLKELGTVQAGFCQPHGFLSYGVFVSSFGYNAYRSSLFRLALSKTLHPALTVGISFQYMLLQTELFNTIPQQFSTDIGLLYKPVDNLLIGLLMMNCPSVRTSGKDFDIEDFDTFYFQTGFQWQVINRVLIAASVQTEKMKLWCLQAGIEYQPFDQFSLRAGFRTANFQPSFGAGYQWNAFQINVASSYHNLLGFSMGVGLNYQF